MKKNAMMKIAAILMVAVLLTTCAISSTFAKYTTSDTSDAETARVAAWGVTVDTTLAGLFANEYGMSTTGVAPNVKALSTSDLLVAPGTQNAIIVENFATGTPEVSVTVTNKVNLTLTGWAIDTNGDSTPDAPYLPLVVKVNNEEVKMGTSYTDAEGNSKTVADAATFMEAVNVKASTTATYAAGTDLSSVTNTADDVKIEWSWAFETGDDNDTKAANNLKDTLLAGTASSVSFTVTTIIEQSAAAGTPIGVANPT